ncbi:KTSC domain-containing protein [Panacibacter sp. DH6]|uniref:KTSC domain-containing protein n=1 Tax=Panacibacter microcysteis TaxID=2793269 RepID=A0A931H041_9BACT|nr:KTSC domain-containing protein [Panacibacter microcysteis]MBG9378555.1 KTSC domain-containing protein [Panacibacter microcysteis]
MMYKPLPALLMSALLLSCSTGNNDTKEIPPAAHHAVSATQPAIAPACAGIPESFASYEQAKNLIVKTTFVYSDKVNTGKSSWIRGASFYSCDSVTGFFVLETDKQSYIHQHMPATVWSDFKNAASFGQFYNQHIKKQYQLQLTKTLR